MKRRNFLKLIGLFVVAPSAMLAASKPKDMLYLRGKDGSLITGELSQNSIAGSRCIYFRGMPIYYKTPLYDEKN